MTVPDLGCTGLLVISIRIKLIAMIASIEILNHYLSSGRTNITGWMQTKTEIRAIQVKVTVGKDLCAGWFPLISTKQK